MHYFSVRAGQILRSAYKAAKGCTYAYCPLLDLYVSGDRCPAITLKYAVEDIIYILKIILQREAAIQLLAGKE